MCFIVVAVDLVFAVFAAVVSLIVVAVAALVVAVVVLAAAAVILKFSPLKSTSTCTGYILQYIERAVWNEHAFFYILVLHRPQTCISQNIDTPDQKTRKRLDFVSDLAPTYHIGFILFHMKTCK